MGKFEEINEEVGTKDEKNKFFGINSNVDKSKIIVYAVFGLITIVLVGLWLSSLDVEEKEKQVVEITPPESESDKYNSKIQALEDVQRKSTPVNIQETFESEEDIVEQENKLKEQIAKMDNEDNIYTSSAPKSSNPGRTTSHEKKPVPPTYSEPKSYSDKQTVVYQNREVRTVYSEPKSNSNRQSESNDNNFFKSGNEVSKNQNKDILLQACIHGDQKVQNGDRVKLRLIKATIVSGKQIPVNTFIYGTCSVAQNRLSIDINKIMDNTVNLQVYDAEDMGAGLYVNTPIINASLKQEIGQEGVSSTALDKVPFGNTIKSILSRKIREEKIYLLNNYKLIIKQND